MCNPDSAPLGSDFKRNSALCRPQTGMVAIGGRKLAHHQTDHGFILDQQDTLHRAARKTNQVFRRRSGKLAIAKRDL